MNARVSKAFTLIELLVVIAIIAILAAILFPVFAQAKDAAKKTAGLSDVKQIDLGYLLYLNDVDDTYPFSVTERYAPTYGTADDTAANAAVYSARELLSPYIKSDQLWKNPSSPAWPAPGSKQWWTVDFGTNFNEGHIQALEGALYVPKNAPYADAYQLASTSNGATPSTVNISGEAVPGLSDFGVNDTVTQTSLAAAANFILIGDAARSDGTPSRGGLYPQPWAFDDSASSFTGSSLQARLYPFHGDKVIAPDTAGTDPGGFAGPYTLITGGVNLGYADGHAKWKNINATWRSYDDNDWRRDPTTP
jgi:prepilin-type N-terminal cleavage/methylation domain-containing protein/prepilin-type processing-associated H-X9-DG protein